MIPSICIQQLKCTVLDLCDRRHLHEYFLLLSPSSPMRKHALSAFETLRGLTSRPARGNELNKCILRAGSTPDGNLHLPSLHT